GHVGEAGEQGVAVRTVAQGTSRNAAEPDLEELEPLTAGVGAGVEQVRRRREARRIEEFGRLLAEQAAQNVEEPTERVRTAGQCCGKLRLEQRTLRDPYLDQGVIAVVEQDLRVENHDHVD